jgi:hypothetical protein
VCGCLHVYAKVASERSGHLTGPQWHYLCIRHYIGVSLKALACIAAPKAVEDPLYSSAQPQTSCVHVASGG